MKNLILFSLTLIAVTFNFSCQSKSSNQNQTNKTSPVSSPKKDRSTNNSIQQRFKKLGLGIPKNKTKAPAFFVSNLQNTKVTLGDFKGKLVLLNFWATWCGPCVKEMPSIESLHKKMKGKNFVILAISNEDKPTVENFVKENGYTFPILLGDAAGKYGVTGIPATFIIDQQGFVIAVKTGLAHWDSEEMVKLLSDLAQNKK